MSTVSYPAISSSLMVPSDLEEVMVVENRNYEFPWTKGIFSDCIKAGYSLYVLRIDKSVIGYGVMQLAVDEAHILNLCIDRKFNHRGYARQLLEQLLELAERSGAKMAFLEVRPSNPRASRMYEMAGFNEVGVRKDYYNSANGREDALVMAKSIGMHL